MTHTRTIIAAAALSVLSTFAVGAAAANDRLHWNQLPDIAFLAVFHHYCAPAQIVAVALPGDPAPTGDAAEIHNGLFVAEYGGDCRAFYFGEVAPRIDVPTQQGLIVVDR